MDLNKRVESLTMLQLFYIAAAIALVYLIWHNRALIAEKLS